MRIKMYATAAVLVLVIAGVFIWQTIKSSDEEGPIIVKNGSIEIEAIGGEWKDGNSEWINQTTGTMNANELWVKVTSSTGTCRGVVKPVHIQYSQPSVHLEFTTSGMWWMAKTRVSPRAGVALVDRTHLRAGTAGDGGHITEVRAQNQICPLSANSMNVEVNICSSSKVTACQ
jgi:hypothetical protein